jgi:predicted metal-dependent enzyme (double-stranded beta helix superfamily)
MNIIYIYIYIAHSNIISTADRTLSLHVYTPPWNIISTVDCTVEHTLSLQVYTAHSNVISIADCTADRTWSLHVYNAHRNIITTGDCTADRTEVTKCTYCSLKHNINYLPTAQVTVHDHYIYIHIYICTGCFKKSFTTLKAYRNLYRGHTHFDSSKRSVCPLYKFL